MENAMFFEIENEQLYTVEGGNVVSDGATIIAATATGAEIGASIAGPAGGVVGGVLGLGCGVLIVVTD